MQCLVTVSLSRLFLLSHIIILMASADSFFFQITVQSRDFFTSPLTPAENCSEPPAISLTCLPRTHRGPAAVLSGSAAIY